MLPSHSSRTKPGTSVQDKTAGQGSAETSNLLDSDNVTQQQKKPAPPASKVLFAILGYMTCSSLMLIANKVAVYNVPAPSFILFIQMFSCAVFCVIIGLTGLVDLDSLEISKVKPFIPVVFVFLGTIYANIKTLQYCNVETFIVFRASTPLAVSIGEYFFLNRDLPSLRSWACLLGILCGAVAYMKTDAGWNLSGYRWVIIWYGIFISDQLYIKHVCEKVKMKSNWGRVYYTNLLTSIPLAIGVIYNQEISLITWNKWVIMSISLACLLGIMMSYFAFLARHLVSAAYFTVLGNVCKVITVLINYFMWDNHANLYGIGSLFICLVCAYFYQQAPKRAEKRSALKVPV